MRRKKALEIDLSDISYNMPLGIEELESFIRLSLEDYSLSQEHLQQFMHRALLTAQQVKDLRINFDNELRKKTLLHSQKSGASIDPLVAAKFLTREQQISLLDSLSKDQIAYLERKKEKIDKAYELLNILLININAEIQLSPQAQSNYLELKNI